jgi:predicted GNAT family acetyltransferase
LLLERHPDARAFLGRAEAWLEQREIEHATVLQSARQARANDRHYERPMYWATITGSGELLGCAYRTPPFKVGCTVLPAAAIPLLVKDLAATYAGSIAGFSGPEPTVSELAAAWVQQRGGSWSVSERGRLLSLPRVTARPGLRGVLRLAGSSDTALAQSWGAAVSIDSGIAALDGRVCAQLIGAKQLYFWGDDQPRCMIGLLRETPQSVAIGIVYTPAAFRGQGYAASAIAALSDLLDERGVVNRYLWIAPDNDGAQALARKLGCQLVYDALDIDCA